MNLDEAVYRRARRAYELGRLGAALPFALVVPPLAWIASQSCHRSGGLLLPISILAAVSLVVFRWRGQDFGRAVMPGVLIGLAGYAVPVLAVRWDLCPLVPSPMMTGLCGLAGLISGLALTVYCAQCDCCSRERMLTSGVTVGLIAAIGCAPAGLGGLVGMAVALALSGATALVLTRAT